MSKNLGLYLHIPFCRSKCPYCDFFSMRANQEEYDNYIKILKENIKYWSSKTDKVVDTIYFGGGTPSVLKAEQIADLIYTIKNSFNCSPEIEISMEANPKSAIDFDFKTAYNAGLNRVSLGVQSSNENELKTLGRIHSPEDVKRAVKNIKDSGIDNISVDLMLGVPGQTVDSLKNSVDFCVSLDVKHISTYILKIEENTIFYKSRDKYNFPDEDLTADLYLFTIEYLAENGFYKYEISNFSKECYECKHNLKYWNLDDYLGLGPAAHSFMDGERFFYDRSIDNFRNNEIIKDGEGGTPSEYIMLQMRLSKGLNLKKFKEAFGAMPDKDFFEKIKKYSDLGYIIYDKDIICFTEKGFLVSNNILADLI